jgi:cyclophilin family peptidyl-prolyl cis-trans isomerase/HEAT repeat protein
MSVGCSSRRAIPFASSLALLLVATRAPAQQPDEVLVGELARLLAAADARAFDPALLRAALGHAQPGVRRQAALAAGRIGDPSAVELLVAALRDSDRAVQAAAAFALGLLKDPRAVQPLAALVRAVTPAQQGAPEVEAVTALAKIGGDEAARALGDLVGSGSRPGVAPPPAVSAALLEAWRLGSRAPIAALVGYAEDADAEARWHAVYALGRLRAGAGVPTLLAALRDREPFVRATALRGLTRAAADSAKLDPGRIAGAVRLLLGDGDPAVRVNALRALASFRDSTLAAAAASLATDPDVNVAVQAETTLGALGGSVAMRALAVGGRSAVFALRRQAVIGLAQADSAAGVAAAAALATDPDWRWRSVACEGFGAARDRARLEGALADPDGRVVAQALQALGRVVVDSDAALVARARELLGHADPAVRSVAADLLARRPDVADVDRLVTAYQRAGGDPFDDARLSAVAALGAVARGGTEGRLRVAARFVAAVPRPDDYLVRRVAADRLPDAAEAWGPVVPIATGKTDADYRDAVRRVLLPALQGGAPPRVILETDRGSLVVELLPTEAPLTVAAFLSLVERRYFDGARWHRVVPNFVAQDGDPRGDGWGGPGFVLRDEVNPSRYGTGTMGMALSGPDTGGSQFFITHSAQPHLDGAYTVLGRVVAGLTVLAGVAQGDRIRSIHR